jgi:hypothetical protein
MRIQILHVPGCPNTDVLMTRLAAALGGAADVERTVVHNQQEAAARGMTGSPTLLIDGVDPFAAPGLEPTLSCRLYLDEQGAVSGAPTVAQLRAAMTTTSDDVHGAAFRALLRTKAPVTPAQLASELRQSPEQVDAAITALHGQGLMRLDDTGRITGAAGLSIRPDRHQMDLDGHRYWTWCAYDFLGIFAALEATGSARSVTPDTGQPVEVSFSNGQPEPSPLMLFLPDDACCTSTYDEWCPNSNLFRSGDAARAWAAQHGLTGTVLTLPEAAERGGKRWRPLTSAG